MNSDKIHIALVGNPNCGKTSIFNCLTGLSQQVGNFPGVTVDKTTGSSQFDFGGAEIIDLPGTYSIYPTRLDEWVSYKVLLGIDKSVKVDLVVIVADASALKRNLLFCTQLLDLKIPVVIVLTMMDIAQKKGINIDLDELEIELGVPVVAVNPRTKRGIPNLKKIVSQSVSGLYKVPPFDFIEYSETKANAIEEVKKLYPNLSNYKALHYLIHSQLFVKDEEETNKIEAIKHQTDFKPFKIQAEEILKRYNKIDQVIKKSVSLPDRLKSTLITDKLDNILLHRRYGYLILLGILFLIFQSVFWLASYPMDWIDNGVASLSQWLSSVLPDGIVANFLVNGLLPGLGGIIIFVPQIAILFGIITLLEDTGYMARISFLTDRLMRSVGLNGKSIMPMISGFACAIPAIMSTRNIENKKERLLTILITPLMSCSARLPIYTIIIGLVIPKTFLFGFIGLQGIVMLGLYFFGVVIAMLVSFVAQWLIKTTEKSIFILELPLYRSPRWGNMLQTMWNKSKVFLFDAGKIIIIISLALWVLSNYGPPGKMKIVQNQYEQNLRENKISKDAAELQYANARLENSFVGIAGKAIEPIIAPLGYDWKIGIALITSFAAREVFVGTMATLYGVTGDAMPLREKMSLAKRSDGSKVYTLGTGVSLLLFYLLAMQCMSTLAVVKRETRSWKWPVLQLVYMTGLAYFFGFLAYQLL